LTADAKDTFALKGEVYPTAFKIEMKNAANRKLTSVKAGTYRIKVEDPSSIHNFRLKGPGVNKATTVVGKSERIWTLSLKKGTYTYVCDPHAGAMKGTFRVT
jgi:plastocyanin